MLKRRFRLPSPALVISMVTLSLVLGGTAVAATATTHKDKKADTKLIKQLAPTRSVKHAKTADSATNATNATNATICAKVRTIARTKPPAPMTRRSAAVSAIRRPALRFRAGRPAGCGRRP